MKPSLKHALLLTLLPYAALAADPGVPYADIEPRSLNAPAPEAQASESNEVAPMPAGSVLDDFAFVNQNENKGSKESKQSQGQPSKPQSLLPHLEGF